MSSDEERYEWLQFGTGDEADLMLVPVLPDPPQPCFCRWHRGRQAGAAVHMAAPLGGAGIPVRPARPPADHGEPRPVRGEPDAVLLVREALPVRGRRMSEFGLVGGALRNGKASALRRALAEELAAGGHAHWLNREGAWCVTRTQIGALWELLPRPQPRDVIAALEYDLY